jgi:predicted transcriptional regulator
MTTTAIRDIRTEIKKYIDHADERMLKIVYRILEADQSEDWWDEISAEERDGIEEGIKQLKNGEGIPHEEVMKKYSKWLIK